MTYNGVDQPGGRQEDQHPSMISPSGLLQGATCKMDVGEVYGNFHHISKLDFKAILLLGILHHIKSLIGPLELQSTHKTFVHILWIMALSPLHRQVASPASLLAHMMLWKIKPSRSLKSSMVKLSRWASQFIITDRSVVSLSSTTSLLA